MDQRIAVALAALVAGIATVFFTGYMVGGHDTEHIVELLIAQYIGNGLLAAILVVVLLR
jgi:hypothetical protein